MKISIEANSICGLKQAQRGTGLQDSYYVISRPDGFSAAVTDGASCAGCAAQGAEITAQCVVRILESDLSGSCRTEKIKLSERIMAELDRELDRAARNNDIARKELASTLMFAAFDGKELLFGHLGDGVIMGLHGGNASVISFPDNDGGSGTYLTSTRNAGEHLRICKVNAADYDGIVLMTDGMMKSMFSDLYIPKKALPFEELLYSAADGSHNDDASFVIIKWRNKNG
jgi:serine/threonine protein phosphatase PrpC